MTDGVADLGHTRLDLDRERRLGLPEVVYGQGKHTEHLVEVVGRLLVENRGPVLVTRVDPATAAEVAAQVPGGTHDAEARIMVWRPAPATAFRLAVVSAGTTDGPVAAEAVAVARAVGLVTQRIDDVGVAGLHRLLAVRGDLERAHAVVVVAGMEGALASVVGGLVGCPVVAVPTSTGYGAALAGVTALLAMLTSCAPGVTVVNIDSGFGAAMAAYRLARTAAAP